VRDKYFLTYIKKAYWGGLIPQQYPNITLHHIRNLDYRPSERHIESSYRGV